MSLLCSCAHNTQTASARQPGYRLQTFRVTPPKVPSQCQTYPPSDHRWILFVRTDCQPCHELMRTLPSLASRYKKHQIQIILVWTDLRSCLAAHQQSHLHHRQWYTLSSPWQEQQWAVEATPTLYLQKAGQLRARIDGVLSPKTLWQHWLSL